MTTNSNTEYAWKFVVLVLVSFNGQRHALIPSPQCEKKIWASEEQGTRTYGTAYGRQSPVQSPKPSFVDEASSRTFSVVTHAHKQFVARTGWTRASFDEIGFSPNRTTDAVFCFVAVDSSCSPRNFSLCCVRCVWNAAACEKAQHARFICDLNVVALRIIIANVFRNYSSSYRRSIFFLSKMSLKQRLAFLISTTCDIDSWYAQYEDGEIKEITPDNDLVLASDFLKLSLLPTGAHAIQVLSQGRFVLRISTGKEFELRKY